MSLSLFYSLYLNRFITSSTYLKQSHSSIELQNQMRRDAMLVSILIHLKILWISFVQSFKFDVLFNFVQHYRQIYEDVHKLRDLYYMKYMHALRKHVEKQRDGIQKRSEKLKQHLEKKQAQEVCQNSDAVCLSPLKWNQVKFYWLNMCKLLKSKLESQENAVHPFMTFVISEKDKRLNLNDYWKPLNYSDGKQRKSATENAEIYNWGWWRLSEENSKERLLQGKASIIAL